MSDVLKSLPQTTAQTMADSLSSSLGQELGPSSTDLLDWTISVRRISGQRVILPECQKTIYRDLHSEVIIMKGTQIFISEYLINLSLWALDTKYAQRGNVFYAMPTQVAVDDFSQSRVDKAIEDSPYLRKQFAATLRQGRKSVDRTRLKKLRGSSLYLRGSDSLKQLTTVDADIVIDDEVDFFTKDTISWTKERLGSSRMPLFRAVSKPTYPNQGIHDLFLGSDQREWHIRCEHCNRWQPLSWEKNIVFSYDRSLDAVTDVKVLCYNPECRLELNRLGPGQWIAAHPNRSVHGYHISRLLSPYVNLREMAEESLKVADPSVIQKFYNSGLGLPYVPKGGRLVETELQWTDEYNLGLAEAGYGGVDVGLKLHTSVVETINGRIVIRAADEFDTFEELDIWFKRHNLKACIIDARGDPRATVEWSQRHPDRVFRWLHTESAQESRYKDDTQEIRINRTSLLDNMYTKCREGLLFPQELRHVSGFVSHLKALVRELVKDPKMNKLIPRYIGAAPDHYAFALAFALQALGDVGDISHPVLVERTPIEFTGHAVSHSIWTGRSGGSRLGGWRRT